VKDVDINKLKENLEAAGYSVWLDIADLHIGTDWYSVIGDAVIQCKALVAIIGSRFISSQHCKNEFYMACSLKKPILSVLLEEPVTDSGILLAVSGVNWIHAQDGFDPKLVCAQLLRGLETLNIQP